MCRSSKRISSGNRRLIALKSRVEFQHVETSQDTFLISRTVDPKAGLAQDHQEVATLYKRAC